MKTFLLIFLSSTCLLSQTDVKQDKLVHFGAGALVSILSYGPIHKHTKSTSKALVYSTACALLVGTAKEVYDAKYHSSGFGAEDLAVTAFGGLMASSFITISIKDKEKRKQLEKIEKYKKEEQLLPKEIPLDAKITGVGALPEE
jgi:uncharacterized protein YfiM (DUF2279 family)